MDLNSKFIIVELEDKIGVGPEILPKRQCNLLAFQLRLRVSTNNYSAPIKPVNHRIMSDSDSDDDSSSTEYSNERRIELPASVVIPFH